MSHSIILVPFIFAFLTFVLRFYARERAASMANPSFLLALLTVLVAGTYLFLGVIEMLPAYGEAGFGLAGVALLVLAVARMFMI
jgi:hypothetical protein